MRSSIAAPHRFTFRRGSLAFALLLATAPFVRADASPADTASATWDVTVTRHDLPPHEVGTPPARPHGLNLPRFPTMEERPRWTALDRSLATSYLVFSGLDAWQTGHLPEGYREGNPMVSSWAGDRPRVGQAVAFKAVVGLGALALTRRLERPGHRRAVLILMNVVQASVVALNERRTGGILFR